MANDSLKLAIQRFEDIRDLDLRKKPATAELLAWIRLLTLGSINLNSDDPDNARRLAASYSSMAKTKDDRTLIIEAYPK